MIDAGLTDVSAAFSRKYYEVQDHGTVSPLFSVFFHIYVNPDWWKGLDEGAQKAILDASAKAEAEAIRITEETASAAPDQLRGKGMKVHIHSEAERETFRGIMEPAFREAFMESAGADGETILQMIQKM